MLKYVFLLFSFLLLNACVPNNNIRQATSPQTIHIPPTALHKAVRANDINRVRRLISQKYDVNAVADIDFETPLSKKKKFLRSATPLHITGITGSLEIAKLLIQNGADINAQVLFKDKKTKRYSKPALTPELLAASFGYLDLVKFLYTNPSRTVKENPVNKWTSLHMASRSGRSKTVSYLIKQGEDINKKVRGGYTAVVLAARSGNFETLKLLLDAGGDLHIITNKGNVVSHAAARSGNLDMLKFIQNKGGDINHPNSYGFLPIHAAAIHGENEIIKFLLDYEANINAQTTKSGWTPLHYAKRYNKADTVSFLIKNGADTTIRDKTNRLYTTVPVKRQRTVNAGSAPTSTSAHVSGNTDKSMPGECLKLLASLRVCQEAGGFLQMACEYGAKSQFDCPVPIGQLLK